MLVLSFILLAALCHFTTWLFAWANIVNHVINIVGKYRNAILVPTRAFITSISNVNEYTATYLGLLMSSLSLLILTLISIYDERWKYRNVMLVIGIIVIAVSIGLGLYSSFTYLELHYCNYYKDLHEWIKNVFTRSAFFLVLKQKLGLRQEELLKIMYYADELHYYNACLDLAYSDRWVRIYTVDAYCIAIQTVKFYREKILKIGLSIPCIDRCDNYREYVMCVKLIQDLNNT